MPYKLTVGLEIHAELKTSTKMFCDSKNDPDEERPNVNICPVCMGHPGTLPVINREAVRHVLRMGTAVGGKIADFTEFDRKNYFYPDIPKDYQISQYKYPLVQGGSIAGFELTRIHLEEDTASSHHEAGDYSLVNYNRAGVPLMELVTEPVIHSAADAARFAKELQLLLRYLGAGDANMEKGEMRVEANISVSASDVLGTKVEVKNLNSFRSVEKAIEFEYKRHVAALEKGEELVQETRGWDEAKQVTFSQRKKESSHDYRYFPDPDLPKLKISEIPEFSHNALRGSLPELPQAKRERLVASGLKESQAEVLTANFELGAYYDEVMNGSTVLAAAAEQVANYVTSDLIGLLGGEGAALPGATNFRKLMELKAEGKIPTRVTKDLLGFLVTEDKDPEILMEEKGIKAGDENELKQIVAKIVAENQKAVDEYKAGKEASLQFLLGQGMRATKGTADPGTLKNLILEEMKK
ncbi:MAG TPA: Asp-tRNA(Asn)/Glu-tRNA(Gln) amidotransferase subunit GatB [Candidatus Paceibacterota bacterium]|nr:Asp-tRNA(Asn)/Glu-tRNA(Gln) amidotransferase subunit GatB [Candidatus Paceibacterota bacterium]